MVHNFHSNTVHAPERTVLSSDAIRMLDLPNAGGNSVWSEVISYETMRMLFNCRLARTEMEIAYFPYGSSITDYSVGVSISTDTVVHLGVSVTRAMAYRNEFTITDATRLLNKKLYGVINSTRCVMKDMRWRKQILHVWVQEPYMIPLLMQAYHHHVDTELYANTLVVFTVSQNAEYIYTNVT
jgi:hypothetical protein